MTMDEVRIGIQHALLRASVVRPEPEDDAGHAEWVEWMTQYLWEFFKRARMPGMKLEKAEGYALKDMRRKYRNEVAARYLEAPLGEPGEPT